MMKLPHMFCASRLVSRFLMVALAVTLSSCAAVKPGETIAKLTISDTLKVSLAASDTINPDSGGRPSPVAIRIYLLSSEEEIKRADFFDLLEDASGTLGASLITEKNATIQPGSTVAVDLENGRAATHLAVVAGFRQLDDATWLSVSPIKARRREIDAAFELDALSVRRER